MMEDLFKNNGLKTTHQRELIFSVVNDGEEPTIKYIQDKCLNKVDKSTVYRIVELFVEKRIFIKNINIIGDVYYTINTLKHVHYIDCIKCHKKTKINHCPITLDVSIDGYTVLSHSIQLEGICNTCQKKAL